MQTTFRPTADFQGDEQNINTEREPEEKQSGSLIIVVIWMSDDCNNLSPL